MMDQAAQTLKKIHEAEARAEKTMGEARVKGKKLVEEARIKAKEIRDNARDDWSRVYEERFEQELTPLAEELQDRLYTEREKIRRRAVKNRTDIDQIVERLVRMILP